MKDEVMMQKVITEKANNRLALIWLIIFSIPTLIILILCFYFKIDWNFDLVTYTPIDLFLVILILGGIIIIIFLCSYLEEQKKLYKKVSALFLIFVLYSLIFFIINFISSYKIEMKLIKPPEIAENIKSLRYRNGVCTVIQTNNKEIVYQNICLMGFVVPYSVKAFNYMPAESKLFLTVDENEISKSDIQDVIFNVIHKINMSDSNRKTWVQN